MCYLIEFAIPKALAAQMESGARERMYVQRASSSLLSPLIPKTYDSYLLLESQCSCNLYTGPTTGRTNLEKERAKLKRKGWSEAKVERALYARTQPPKSSLREDAHEFLSRMGRQVPSMYLVVYWTDDAIGDGIEEMKAAQFVEGVQLSPGRVLRITA